MTDNGGKTGTPQIVWAVILFVAALIGILQMPSTLAGGVGATIAGAIVGTVLFATVGVLLLIAGLSRRRQAR